MIDREGMVQSTLSYTSADTEGTEIMNPLDRWALFSMPDLIR